MWYSEKQYPKNSGEEGVRWAGVCSHPRSSPSGVISCTRPLQPHKIVLMKLFMRTKKYIRWCLRSSHHNIWNMQTAQLAPAIHSVGCAALTVRACNLHIGPLRSHSSRESAVYTDDAMSTLFFCSPVFCLILLKPWRPLLESSEKRGCGDGV